MKKEEAIRIITECAKRYHENLESQNILFMFGSPQLPEYFEVAFLPRNFLHLTGVELTGNRFKSSVDFYDRCLKERLNPSDFSMPPFGMSDVKLTVLPQLMSIHKTAKMVGDYNGSKPVLITDKLAGNVTACMGFVLDSRYYMPNTALKSDIRDLVGQFKRIIAIFRKPIRSPTYAELCYTAKGLDLSKVSLPEFVHMPLTEDNAISEKRPSVLARLREPLPERECKVDLPHKLRQKGDRNR